MGFPEGRGSLDTKNHVLKKTCQLVGWLHGALLFTGVRLMSNPGCPLKHAAEICLGPRARTRVARMGALGVHWSSPLKGQINHCFNLLLILKTTQILSILVAPAAPAREIDLAAGGAQSGPPAAGHFACRAPPNPEISEMKLSVLRSIA